jgi:hypothetical protein
MNTLPMLFSFPLMKVKVKKSNEESRLKGIKNFQAKLVLLPNQIKCLSCEQMLING